MRNGLLYFYYWVSCVSCLIKWSICTIYYYYHFLSFVSSFVFYAILRFCILAGEKIKIRVNHHVVECYCAGILNGNTFLAGWTPSGQSWCWATLHLSPRMLMAVMMIKSNPIFLLFLHGFTQFKKSVGNFFSNFLIYLFWEQCSKKKWSFLMTFAIKHPPSLLALFSTHFFTPLLFFCNVLSKEKMVANFQQQLRFFTLPPYNSYS